MQKSLLFTAAWLLVASGLLFSLPPRTVHAQESKIASDTLRPDVSFAAIEPALGLPLYSPPADSVSPVQDVAPEGAAFYLAQSDMQSRGGNRGMTDSGEGNGNSYGGASESTDRLIDGITNPIAPLMQYRFRGFWNWPIDDAGPNNEQFEFRPTIPLKLWDQENLLRISIPYKFQDGAPSGLDKVQIFDAAIFSPDWGKWGFGPDFRLDPNSGEAGDFQIGPVFGGVVKNEHWTCGFINQNFLGGNDSETYIQPVLAYKFNDQLALALGDMQFKYSWSDHKWVQLPLGIEVDYIANLWGQKIQFFADPQYNFVTDSSNSGWTIFFGMVLLVPEG